MGKPILFVVNPISGNKNKDVLIREVRNWCGQQGFDPYIYKTTGEGDVAAIKEKINETDARMVIAVGGDGTVKMCAGILKDTRLQLGILPAGSANGMATDLQIPENVSEALDIIKSGKTLTIDLLQFNGEELGLHISDLGLNAGLIRKFEESGNRGFLGYVQGVIDKVQDIRNFEFEVEIDNEVKTFTSFMVAIANAQRYGTGAILNTKGKINDGLMEICVFEQMGILDLTRHFLEQLTEDDSHYTVLQCKEAIVRVSDQEVPFQIDGEYKGERKEVFVKVLPQCLHVKMPH